MPEFEIHALRVGGGDLALCPVPGRTGAYAADRDRVIAWRPALVVTLTAVSELERAGAADLPADLAAAGIGWRHFPVVDFGVPGEDAPWEVLSQEVRGLLASRARVLAHCFGGCGRSGMVVLRLMVETGEGPDAALARLRAVRPCAVETVAQIAWAQAGL